MSRWLALVVKRRVCGHVLVDQRHGANNHVVPNGKGVGDDATVGTHAYVVTNVQVIVFKAKGFNSNRRILPDEKITPNCRVTGYHHAGKVRDSQSRANARANINIEPVLEVQLLLHSPRTFSPESALGMKVLGEPERKQKPQLIVLSGAPENVRYQPYAAAYLFLVRYFNSPAFK